MVLFFTCGSCAPHAPDDAKPRDQEDSILVPNLVGQLSADRHHEDLKSGRLDEVSDSKTAMCPVSRQLTEDEQHRTCATTKSSVPNSGAPVVSSLATQVPAPTSIGPAESGTDGTTTPTPSRKDAQLYHSANVARDTEMRESSLHETPGEYVGIAEGSPTNSTTGTPTRRRRWLQRGSIDEAETIVVPTEYRHLVKLAALLPQRVIETVVVQRRLGKPGKPCFAVERVDAALLFVDISGFTASMEMFAQQGSQGIEKFWKMFNAYFCDLLDIIQGTGGDIDCFAGDAILVVYETQRLWERTGELVRSQIQTIDGIPLTKLCLATMAASQCGGRLLNGLSPYHFSDGAVESSLTLHGSIGAGSLRTVNIGGKTAQGDESFATFVCGSVFEQLAVAHDLSGKSEFCLSGEAVLLTGHWLDLWDHPEHQTCKILKGVRDLGDVGQRQQEQEQQQRASPTRNPTPAATSTTEENGGSATVQGLIPAKAAMPSLYRNVSEDTNMFTRLKLAASDYEGLAKDLKSFISKSVLDKMATVQGGGSREHGSTLGELRRGTVGFVKFDIKDINSAACADPSESIKEVAQVAMMGFREVVIAGGYVNKVIMDEKGLVLLYAFGTPGCSYEYNNLHAIRVALMITKSSKERFGRKTGVGIATGNMCTGVIGKPNFRAEYALAGDVVNLAARLAAASEKEGKGVLCDETTLESLVGEDSIHKEAMLGIRVQSVGSMRPKGKSYDINVFKLNNTHIKREGTRALRKSSIEARKRDEVLPSVRRSSLNFIPVASRAEPLEKIRACVRRCNAGDIHCVYLQSEAGMGKSSLVSALTKDPGINAIDNAVMETPTGERIVVEGRDVHVVKIQGGHLEQSTPYHALSALTTGLMAIIVEPDRKGRINMLEFSEAMPTEVQRYLELLRYLNVPMSHSTERSYSDSTLSRKQSRRQKRNSVGHSVSTFQSLGSDASASKCSRSGSRNSKYHFQRFKGEGQEDASEFESATELSLEAAEVLCSGMRAGISVEDRDYGSTVFKQAFVGSEAVDWMCASDIAGTREEAVAIGQRLVEFGLVDHVNSVFRFKDAVLFYEFRTKATTWSKAAEMDLDSAKALAMRINMEIDLETVETDDGEVHKACFSGESLTEWMINEYVATCMNEAVAIADKLMTLSIIESTTDIDQERFKPCHDHFYVLRALALSALPPTHIFGLMKQLCLSILQVACTYAADAKELVMIVVDDLQWVDSGTLDMIQAFLEAARDERWTGGCMFLLSTRPPSTFPAHLRSTRDKMVTESDNLTMVELGVLSEREAERLTCCFLEVDELDFSLRKLVLKSCSGSPLFISELCQSLCATEGIQKVTTSASKSRAALKSTGKDGEESATPTSVQEIVAARIDTLESTASLVLKVAAVIGETFTFDVLHAVFPVDLDEEYLATHLADLVFKNFLTIEDDRSPTEDRPRRFKFTHSLMSVAAYGMLLHSYRWKLHYRVAVVMTDQEDHSHMVLARHWLQVAMGNPSAAEIADVGGDDAYRELLHMTIGIVSNAIADLMGMGQFIEASSYFKEGLEVMERMPDTPRRKCLEIELLLQGCQLTSFIEGYTTALLDFARKAYALACEGTDGVTPESRLRAGLFVEQYEVMYGDATLAIGRLEVLFQSIPAKGVVLRIEPAAILAVTLTQRGQFKQARVYTKVIEEWKAAGSPVPLCLVMYEPVVTLLSMSVVLAAMGADDSKHLRWLNDLESYLKDDSGVSKRPFNLYASMSLFGMIYPMCFEYAEMVRFYHSVYRVVYHPQVLLPIRRGLMFQTASATSRVQAKNMIITQGIEIMSLMCQAYQSVTLPVPGSKKPKQFFNQLMSIVRAQPSPACCAAVYQTARLLHLWDRAREVLQLWDGLPSFGASEDARRSSRLSNRRLTDAKLDGAAILTSLEGMSSSSGLLKRGSSSTESNEDGDTGGVAVDVYEAILFFCKADVEVQESMDKQSLMDKASLEQEKSVELRLDKLRLGANLFSQTAVRAAAIGNCLMEVRASSACARLLWESLDRASDARQMLRQIFDKFDTLCSLPNFFTPLRLTGLTAAMRLNSDMGGCYDDDDEDDDEDSDEYGFGAMHEDDDENESESSSEGDGSDSNGPEDNGDRGGAEEEEDKEGEVEEEKGDGDGGAKARQEGEAGVEDNSAGKPTLDRPLEAASPPRSNMKGSAPQNAPVDNGHERRCVRFRNSAKIDDAGGDPDGDDPANDDPEERIAGQTEEPAQLSRNRRTADPVDVGTLVLPQRPSASKRTASFEPHGSGAHRVLSPSLHIENAIDEGG